MTEPTESPPKPRRTWLPMALWTAGILLALVVVWAGASLYSTLRETRRALDEVASGSLPVFGLDDFVPEVDPGRAARAVAQLGGQEKAARKVALHRRLSWILPERLSPSVEPAVLGQCGKDGVPALIEGLKSKEPWSRVNCACWLAEAGKQSPEEAVAALIQALDDPDETVRRVAVFALRKLGPQAKAAIPALEKMRGRSDGPGDEFIDRAIKKIRGEEDPPK